MIHGGGGGYQYDVEKLRNLNSYDKECKDDEPSPSHSCQTCGWETAVDDHKKHAPNWCESCERVRTFVKLSDE